MLVVANDGSERARLEALALEWGVSSQVRFVGRLGAAEQAREYGRATYFLSLPASDSVAVSMAVIRVLKVEFGVDVAQAAFVAGHSLGEYSALAAAGALSVSDTARLLKLRGQAMQRAVPVGKGAMASLIGPKTDLALAEAAAAAGAEVGVCVVANDNNAGNVVISGEKAAAKYGRLMIPAFDFNCEGLPPGVNSARHDKWAFDVVELFPNMVTQMVAIGEESGAIDAMLGKVADWYEQEVDDAVDALTSLLEPLIMAVLGVLIGGLVIAMYLPIFKMGSVM